MGFAQERKQELRDRREALVEKSGTGIYEDPKVQDTTRALLVILFDEETFEVVLEEDPSAIKQAIEAVEALVPDLEPEPLG